MTIFSVIVTIFSVICVIVFGWFSYQSFLKLRNPSFDKTTNRLDLILNPFIFLINLAAIFLIIL